MTASLAAKVEALLREQVSAGRLPAMDRALEPAVETMFGRQVSHALESLLDDVLSNLGERVSLSQLRRKTA